ncbi:MAG: 50S ribosomal protein L30 [Candidatus Nezhaarchaeota archaeon]|nr:50S ribosomal protein L30 [Candidatus Nezhaarchaeota archaeon]MCX8141756.1 50S ribosomal protein L30 [Candidatus Nezhaarchaeota archaeon]MDW8050466.1 50S ribosomal protein L30 [Nitrososphaerota archaeon]
MSKLYAVIRLRGCIGVPPDIEFTLRLLRLTRKNHCTIVEATPSIEGMLKKASGYITYGEISEEALATLLEKRAKLLGDKKLTLNHVKRLGFENFKDLARAIVEGKIKLKDVPGLKLVFRLHPPRKGFKGTIKKSFEQGGELGYRGSAINELITKMA